MQILKQLTSTRIAGRLPGDGRSLHYGIEHEAGQPAQRVAWVRVQGLGQQSRERGRVGEERAERTAVEEVVRDACCPTREPAGLRPCQRARGVQRGVLLVKETRADREERR